MGDISRFEWRMGHENKIVFVMIDGSGVEVTGLGGTLTIEISKNAGALQAAAGTQGEIGNGGYWYLATVAEADTAGPIFITANGAGAVQQNLEYVVSTRSQNTKSYTYPVTRQDTGDPVIGAMVEIYAASDKTGLIWTGTTDASGHARDEFGALPILDIGRTYYIWTYYTGILFPNPDAETVV